MAKKRTSARRKRTTKPTTRLIEPVAKVATLPKITTEIGFFARVSPLLDYAVTQHVQGYTPGPRPRATDPGWEDVIELRNFAASVVEVNED